MAAPNNTLILIGAGGHAVSCIDAIESQGIYKIQGLIGESGEVGAIRSGYSVLGCDADLAKFAGTVDYALVAIGLGPSPEKRKELCEYVSRLGFKFPVITPRTSYISPRASIGVGTVIMHGVTINSAADIGSHCIINTNALIEHEVTISNYSHISTGVIINGGVRVGQDSFIGSGSVLKQGISVGEKCFIGMGQRIVSDVPDHKRIGVLPEL